MTDYRALKEADGLLSPPVSDPAQAAIAVRGVKKTLAPQVIKKAAAREPLWLGGQMALWERFGNQPIVDISAPTQGEQLILLVRTFYLTLAASDVAELDLRDATTWQSFLGRAATLVQVGLLPQSIVDYWIALRTPEVLVLDPSWSPTADDILAARALA